MPEEKENNFKLKVNKNTYNTELEELKKEKFE